MEILIIAFVFAFGAIAALVYLGKARAEHAGVAGVELLFGPAVMMAYDYGFISPDLEQCPELRSFLRNERQDLPRDLLPDVIREADSEVAEYHRYLLYAVAAFWKVFGVSWKSLEPFLALMAGWCAVAVYGLMRLGMNRLLALPLTLSVALSPGMLCVMTDPRDFSKAPFILSILLGTAWVLKTKMKPVSLAMVALLLGLLTGVGMGFRQDVVAFVPLVSSALLWAGLRLAGVSRVHRVLPLLAYTVCFLITGWPMLTRMEGGAGPDHFTIQGFSLKHAGNLGLRTPVYQMLASGTDNYVFASVYSYQNRTEPEAFERFTFNSPQHEAASRRWLLETGHLFPADLLVRGYGAALRTIQYNNAYPPLSLINRPWVRRVLPVHQAFADHMRRFGLVYAAALLLVVGGRSVLLALVMLVFALYACGYVSLQCEYRHTFHLTFVPFWIVGCLACFAGRMLVTRFRRGAIRPDWKRTLPRVGLVAVAVPLLLVVPLALLRVYQSSAVKPVMKAYTAPNLVPVTVSREDRPGWTVFSISGKPWESAGLSSGKYISDLQALFDCVSLLLDEDRRSGNTRTRYLALEFDEIAAGTPLLVMYDTPVPWNDFTQMLAIGGTPGDSGPKTYFFPVYELFMHGEGVHARNRFTGVALPAPAAAHFRGMYEVSPIGEFRLLPHVTKTKDFERASWFQSIDFTPEALSFYRPEVGPAALVQYAEAVRRMGTREDALLVLQAALLVLKEPEQRLGVAESLVNAGEMAAALEVVQGDGDVSSEYRSRQAQLLLKIAGICQERQEHELASVAYREANARIGGDEFAKLLIGDYYAGSGDHRQAALCCLEFLKYHPHSPEAESRLAGALEGLCSEQESLEGLRELHARHPESATVRWRLVDALEKAEIFEEALSIVEPVFQQDREDPDARRYLVALYPLTGRHDAGMALVRETLTEYPDTAGNLVERVVFSGRILVRKGETERAAALCRVLLGCATLKGRGRMDLAGILRDAGDGDGACAQFRLLATDPDVGAEAAKNLEVCFEGDFSATERVQAWRDLVAADPGQAHLRERLALALFDTGAFPESAAILQDTGENAAYEEEVAPRIALLQMIGGDSNEGVRLLEAFLASRSDMTEDVIRLMSTAVDLLRGTGQSAVADLVLEQAIRLAPTDENVWLARMPRPGENQDTSDVLDISREAFQRIAEPWQIARRLDDFLSASEDAGQRLQIWRDLTAAFPGNAVIRVYLAEELLDAGLCLEAVAVYKDLVAQLPDRPEILAGLGVALAGAGQLDEGWKHIEDALNQKHELGPSAAAACVRAADARLGSGDSGGALQLYEIALRTNPSDSAGGIRLGEMYATSGRTEEAQRVYQDVIRRNPDSALACQAGQRWDDLLKKGGGPEARADAWTNLLQNVPNAECLAEFYMVALMDAGKYPEALQISERALAETPESVPLQVAKVILLCRSDKVAEGLQLLDALQPDGTEVSASLVENIADLALSLACRRQFLEAERLAVAAVRLEPANLWRVVRLGEVYALQGRNEDALEQFRHVLAQAPESPRTAAWFDTVSEAAGGSTRRVLEWESLAASHPDSMVVGKGLQDARAGRAVAPPSPCE